jgi:hypothetical protein
VILRRLLLLAWIGSHQEAPIAQALGRGYTESAISLSEDYLHRYG